MSYVDITKLPQWKKFTVTYAYFSTAGNVQNTTIFTLPAKSIIHACMINPTTDFSGGVISAYTISVGTPGAENFYKNDTNVFTGASFSQPETLVGIESMTIGTVIVARATATGAFLNAATAGEADIYLLVSTLE